MVKKLQCKCMLITKQLNTDPLAMTGERRAQHKHEAPSPMPLNRGSHTPVPTDTFPLSLKGLGLTHAALLKGS